MRFTPNSDDHKATRLPKMPHMERESRTPTERKGFRPVAIIVNEYKITRDAIVWLWRERKNMTPRSAERDENY